jgi:hypothetical protein
VVPAYPRKVPGFDVEMYFSALDEERDRRGLTWAALTRELNAPFAHRPDIPPIASSTLTGMRAKGGLNGNTVVHTMMWLRRAPEEFTPGHPWSRGRCLFSPPDSCRDGTPLHWSMPSRRSVGRKG